MATEQSILFSWADVDELPDLRRLALVLEALPDEALLARLAERRGRGRDDYPVRPMWRATIAGIVLQHERSLVRELNRNPALLALCGFSPLDYQDKPKVRIDDDGKPRMSSSEPRSTVPGSHNFSRFLRSLLESKDPWVDGMVRQLREQGRVAGLRRAPRLRRQGREQSQGGPAARPARLPTPTPTGESTRRPASTGRPAIFGER